MEEWYICFFVVVVVVSDGGLEEAVELREKRDKRKGKAGEKMRYISGPRGGGPAHPNRELAEDNCPVVFLP